MLFNEVYKIEQSCFDMLAEKMESETECTQEVIRNFISSHFLLRKLALFRDIEILRRFDSQCE